MNSRAVKIAVSLLLTVCLLCCSVSVLAADDEDDNPLLYSNDQTAAFLIYQLLKSWGIDITYEGVQGWTEPVQDYLMGLIFDFLDDQPSIESVVAWMADWWFGTDFWGNLVVNQTLLDDVEDFADWLVQVAGLQDNNIKVVEPVYSVNGYTVYNFEDSYRVMNGDGTFDDTWYSIEVEEDGSSTAQVIGYINVIIQGYSTNYWSYIFFLSNTNGTVQIHGVRINYLGVEQTFGGTYTIYPSSYNGNLYYERTPIWTNQESDMPLSSIDMLPGRNPWFTGQSASTDLDIFLSNMEVVEEGDLKIVTSNIVLPTTDEAYTPGDGMTIIDGNPQYGPITVPENISVDNLPAVVSTTTLEDPEVDQIYTNIPAFFQMAGDTMNGFKQILFRMPDEVLIAIYAVLSIGVIFGFLRIMREH